MSLSGGCGLVTGVGAGTYDIVENQIAAFTKKGDEAFKEAMNAIGQIAESTQEQIRAYGLGSNKAGLSKSATPPEFVVPQPEPEAPEVEFEKPGEVRNPPNFSGLANIDADVGSVPVFTDAPPQVGVVAQPSRTPPPRPADPDPIDLPAYPAAPETDTPELPALAEIDFPTLNAPDLGGILAQIGSLRSSLPEAPAMPGEIDFIGLVRQFMSFSQPYVDDVLQNLVPRLEELLAGNSTGIPANVALLLRNRAFAAEDQQAFQAEATVIGDWLSRGFTLPGGALEAQLLEVRQKNRDKKAELNRDLWIEETKQEIENLRWAIQQGIAYEGMHKDALIKLLGMAGQLAEQQANVIMKVLDASIEIYKAQAQMWQIQFSVIKDEIQIELSKVEVYKAELEAQKLVGTLNQQAVEVYKAQLEAVNQSVAIYKTQVDAANSMLQAEVAKIDYAAKVAQIYTAEIGAYEAEWRAYGEAVKADSSKVEIYKALTQAYSARVEGYGKSVDIAKTKASMELEKLGLELKAWEAQVEKYKVDLQAETVRVETLGRNYESAVRAFGVKAQAEDSRVSAALKGLDYELNVDKFTADIAIKEAELEQQKALATAKLAVDAMDAVARTSAQLAGSAMSAMNVGASLSSSSGFSVSNGCSESYSYDMSA